MRTVVNVHFKNLDEIESFLTITQNMESDVFLKQGSIQIDAKSSVSMMNAPLNYPMMVQLIDKKGISELDNFIKRAEELKIIESIRIEE